MKKYYFSGIDRPQFIELLAREGAAGMVNAKQALQPAMLEAYLRWPDVSLVLDSGAFQGNIDLAGYAEVIRRIGERFLWFANLDVIGDQAKSDLNWSSLCEIGLEPLWVYQVEGGKDLEYLKRQAYALKFIGVGGLVPVIKRGVTKASELVGNIGEVLRSVGATAHFFGVGSPVILREYSNKPWFSSADSQAWLSGFKAQELIREDGARVSSTGFGLRLTKSECAAQNVRQIHGWMQGEALQLSLLDN